MSEWTPERLKAVRKIVDRVALRVEVLAACDEIERLQAELEAAREVANLWSNPEFTLSVIDSSTNTTKREDEVFDTFIAAMEKFAGCGEGGYTWVDIETARAGEGGRNE